MIECKHLTKVYTTGDTDTKVLDDVSFSIKKGEFIAIMGPSGSGKSTIMNILGLLDTPTQGEYFLEGKDSSRLNDDEQATVRAKRIGFVFQSFNLLPRTTVLRNVALPLIYRGDVAEEEREKRAKEALEAAGFPKEKWNNLSNQLSGGQIQRVAIARALVNDPAIILADEPTGNLDTKTGLIVLDTFKKLNKEQGRTIVLITHEPEVASHADRIIHVKDGKIV
ncbi:MAG: ABC transporter ATP-binding protein [Candidatus Pacebacteria bacterium]|nr:ABC transporter ATP-binding protein [Candidatus Paceibacterota bacterium]